MAKPHTKLDLDFTIEIRVRGSAAELGLDEADQLAALQSAADQLPDGYSVTMTVESAPKKRVVGEHGYTGRHVFYQSHGDYTVEAALEDVGLGDDRLSQMTEEEVLDSCSQRHVDWVFEEVGDNFGWGISEPESE